MQISATSRIVAMSSEAALNIVQTSSGEIVASIPVSDLHSRGGQYLGLLHDDQHLIAGQGVYVSNPAGRCVPIVPDLMEESGANPEYQATDLAKQMLIQQKMISDLEARQIAFQRSFEESRSEQINDFAERNRANAQQRSSVSDPEPEEASLVEQDAPTSA